MSSSPEFPQTPDDAESLSSDETDAQYLLEPQRGVEALLQLGDDRRRAGRLPQESLACNLGPVLDLSFSGMRVLCKRPQQGSLEVRVQASQYSMTLSGLVVWSKRLGFRRHEIGIQFIDVDEDTAHVLSRVSASYRMRRAL